jgi:cytochrome P450
MVLYETLRLYPTVPSFPRLCVKRTKLGGYDIPARTLVAVSQQPMNRSEAIWGKDALSFIPERFEPGDNKPLRRLRPSKPVGECMRGVSGGGAGRGSRTRGTASNPQQHFHHGAAGGLAAPWIALLAPLHV